MPTEGLGHECGLFAIWGKGINVAWLTAQGLDGQQTRGQEGAGIVTTDGKNFYSRKGRGLVVQVFPSPRSVRKLQGYAAIGHTRYSTTGRDKMCNVQPLSAITSSGEEIYLGHNGNLVNAWKLRAELNELGEKFTTTTDTEVIARLLARAEGKNWVERLRAVMEKLAGSYCLSILTKNSIILARDPTGNRPLTIGEMNGYWAAASESGVFNNQPVTFLREVDPGEIVVFDETGMHSYPAENPIQHGMCAFEWIYFLRPDSIFGGRESASVRYRAGELLARRHPVEADLIIGIPRSGFYATDGFHAVSRVPIAHGVVANQHLRVFLTPEEESRAEQYDKKYSVLKIVEGKRVVVIDDSVVRGNSNKRVLKMFKRAGAKELHFRSTFPPIIQPCHLGIDMHTQRELIAAKFATQEEVEKGLAKYWEIETVGFLTVEDLIEAIDLPKDELCLGCLGGRYSTPIDSNITKELFELAPV